MDHSPRQQMVLPARPCILHGGDGGIRLLMIADSTHATPLIVSIRDVDVRKLSLATILLDWLTRKDGGCIVHLLP